MNNPTEKTILITGATSGIGFRAALELARRRFNIIGTGRDQTRCENARRNILQQLPDARINFLLADFSSQSQIRRLAQEALSLIKSSAQGTLYALVNNAGLFADRKRFSEDGIELTFAVNHIAPFLLTHLLLPALTAPAEAKVLTVSSNSHYLTWFDPQRAINPKPYVHLWAYKVSKLSNVLFTAEFNRRNSNSRVRAFAVDPGLVNTDIGLKNNRGIVKFGWSIRQKQGQSVEVPVRTITHLISDNLGQDEHSLYWKNCRPKAPSPAALNADLARRLWEESCRLCGIENYFA